MREREEQIRGKGASSFGSERSWVSSEGWGGWELKRVSPRLYDCSGEINPRIIFEL